MSKEAMKLALEAADELEWMLKSGYEQGREGPPRAHRLIGKIKALAEQPAQQALDKMAENARELGLDYEPAQQEPAHSLGPGQMELSLRRNYKDELFECRRRFSAEEVMHGPDWLVEKVAKQLDAEMDNAIQAWSNT